MKVKFFFFLCLIFIFLFVWFIMFIWLEKHFLEKSNNYVACNFRDLYIRSWKIQSKENLKIYFFSWVIFTKHNYIFILETILWYFLLLLSSLKKGSLKVKCSKSWFKRQPNNKKANTKQPVLIQKKISCLVILAFSTKKNNT